MTTTIAARSALLPDGLSGPVVVEVDAVAGTIVSVSPTTGAVPDRLLAPGFVDLQVNGIDDVDVARATGADWDRLDQLLLDQGTTAWCPTLISSPFAMYPARIDRIAAAAGRPGGPRPTQLGIHLEGPFLGTAPGAHPREAIVPIDLEWLEALPASVRLMTLGAEQPDAVAAISALRARGIAVSIGHSQPTEEEYVAAVGAGATLVTHLFNAMSGVHHRTPGLAAFALTEPRVVLGLIADGIHVHPRLLRLAFAARADGVCLVTDATAWRAGTVGEVSLTLRDGAPRLADGTLAGSCLTMDLAVRTCVAAGVPLESALRAASTVPARAVGAAGHGAIEVGGRADLVGLDHDLGVESVHVGGHQVR